MDTQLDGLTEAELKELLSKAEDYEVRSNIRAAIRRLKGTAGKKRGTSEYRRPGFQAPKSVTIPNSVTGNVLASKVAVTGPSVKPPDKNTPTIGYLGSGTIVSNTRRSSRESSTSSSTFQSNVPKEKDEQQWWQSSRSSSRSVSRSSSTSRPDLASPEPQERRASSERVSEPREVTPEPPREPTPEPTPSPEPPREPTPEPTPSPEPPREPTPEPTPSPEPPREPTPEPTPSPEPPREPTPEPTPSPEPSLSPEPVKEPELSPSPEASLEEQQQDQYSEEEEEEEDEEEHREKRNRTSESKGKQAQQLPGARFVGVMFDAMKTAEPGLEEDKDFRKKLKQAKESKIDTKAAFPQSRPKGAQIDFRDVLRTSGGPQKKDFKSGSKAQQDFRSLLKAKSDNECTPDRGRSPSFEPAKEEEVNDQQEEVKEQEEEVQEEVQEQEEHVQEEEVNEEPPKEEPVEEEDSLEARRERRRREREARRLDEESEAAAAKPQKQEEETLEERRERRRREREERAKQAAAEEPPKPTSNGIESGEAELDSYEARREARRKAREERMKKAMEDDKGSYRQRKAKEAAKSVGDNRKKWKDMDQSNSTNNGTDNPPLSRQRSSTHRGAQQLLAWCQHKTRYYENVEVTDFSNSFANGLALCAILHTFVPEKIPYEDLTPDNRRQNYTVALKAAAESDLDNFFDVEDLMRTAAPDSKSMMTFLATIYQHFKSL